MAERGDVFAIFQKDGGDSGSSGDDAQATVSGEQQRASGKKCTGGEVLAPIFCRGRRSLSRG